VFLWTCETSSVAAQELFQFKVHFFFIEHTYLQQQQKTIYKISRWETHVHNINSYIEQKSNKQNKNK